ncbi:hypothetical protein PENDEC_c013G00901 [Penicillium decumbens]|uniref:Uncharacterized protein n=1 Tax=Penicillium decumbens TaxID=69771 RepID=A0A1V6PA89_PENDC|nr:hypothetical protein PENDEC_c013G00901 [Penicillium decumbens]
MDERRAHAKAYRQKARQIIREFMAMAETYMDALTDLAEDAAESQPQPSGHARAPPTYPFDKQKLSWRADREWKKRPE